MGIVGAGRAGMALALALQRAGRPVVAVSSRDPGRRATLAERLPGVEVVAAPGDVAALADLVLLAVPDDAIVAVAAAVRGRPGSIVAHLSGVHPAALLRDVVPVEVRVGAFHPLVAFAEPERAVTALRGAYVALDGDPAAINVLGALAEALGARPVTLTPAGDPVLAKAAYHAAAVLAAGGFVALLDTIAELGRVAGLDEATAIEVYGSLVRQGLANAEALGIVASLTGPAGRGDRGTVRLHLDAISRATPDVREMYVGATRRQLMMARAGGVLDPSRAAAIASMLDRASRMPPDGSPSSEALADRGDRAPGPPGA